MEKECKKASYSHEGVSKCVCVFLTFVYLNRLAFKKRLNSLTTSAAGPVCFQYSQHNPLPNPALSCCLLVVHKFSKFLLRAVLWFASFSQIDLSLSSGLLPAFLKFCRLFRLVYALFSNSLVSFERLAPCSQIQYSLSSGLLLLGLLLVLSGFLVVFELFAPCSQLL